MVRCCRCGQPMWAVPITTVEEVPFRVIFALATFGLKARNLVKLECRNAGHVAWLTSSGSQDRLTTMQAVQA